MDSGNWFLAHESHFKPQTDQNCFLGSSLIELRNCLRERGVKLCDRANLLVEQAHTYRKKHPTRF